jgi:hypothetical protein
MAIHLSPTELARECGLERREVIKTCMELGVPIVGGRIDKAMFLAALTEASSPEGLANLAASRVVTWSLLDSSGNLIDSFDSEREARKALFALGNAEPGNREHVELIGYNAEGVPVSPPRPRTRARHAV